MHIIGHLAENGLVVAKEFREGNVLLACKIRKNQENRAICEPLKESKNGVCNS